MNQCNCKNMNKRFMNDRTSKTLNGLFVYDAIIQWVPVSGGSISSLKNSSRQLLKRAVQKGL